MSDLVFSIQRDENGDAYFSSQQVTSGRVSIFAEQRGTSGKAIFSTQTIDSTTPIPEANLQASLMSASNLTADILVQQTFFAAFLKSESWVKAVVEVQEVGLAVKMLSEAFVRSSATTEVVPVNPEIIDIDATKVPLARHVVFEGSKRMVIFI